MNGIRGRLGRTLVAVITIVKEEFDAVKQIDQFEEHANKSSCLYRNDLGDNNYDVILVKAPIAAMDRVKKQFRASSSFRPEYIMLSGIGGGVNGRDGIELGDVVVQDHVEYYEMRNLWMVNRSRWIPRIIRLYIFAILWRRESRISKGG